MTWFRDRIFRLPRIWSNRVMRQLGQVFSGEIINVSGWDDRDKEGGRYRDYFISATKYYISNYRGVRGVEDSACTTDFEIDLSQALPDELHARFDVVFNHTTLEHIYELGLAFRNICKMSRDIVIVIVPSIQPMHPTASYGDYWRFTPMSLRSLFAENELHVIFEAANQDVNAGNYLLFVGSRVPQRWREQVPPWQPVETVGDWIGFDWRTGLLRRMQRLAKRS